MYRGYASSKYPRGRPVDPVKGWEYNVWADIPSSQTTFAAPWASMTITPLDTCGLARLSGAEFVRKLCHDVAGIWVAFFQERQQYMYRCGQGSATRPRRSRAR